MFKDRDNYIQNLGRIPSFEEKRAINWAFRYLGKDKAEEYLTNKFAVKKEEKIVKVKNQKDEVS